MHMKLFDLIIFMINLVEINLPNMTLCDYSVTFDDVITLKLKKIRCLIYILKWWVILPYVFNCCL
jgi:hypothetical protein